MDFRDDPPRIEGPDTWAAGGNGTLFSPEEAEHLKDGLRHAVVGFVDSPERSLAEADALLEEAVAQLTESLASHRRGLRAGWQEEDTDTEARRTLLLGYRQLMERLISV